MKINPLDVKNIQSLLKVGEKEALNILEKAVAGGETTYDEANIWFEERLKPNVVFLDEEGYAKMCIDALKITSSVAGTDYGSTRQRDMAQLWADTTRGYLGELGFKQFLQDKFSIRTELGHEQGELSTYLPLDIHKVQKPNEDLRDPKIKLGVKATKWNGIWFDIPGDQFIHSDIHVLVKVGAGRDHLFAFLKSLSVFKDKVLRRGQSIGHITDTQASDIYEALPNFKSIPAYICGFIKSNATYKSLDYSGRLKRESTKTHQRSYTINTWNGPIHDGDLKSVRDKENVTGKMEFVGIGKFAHDEGYLFNTGNLLWKPQLWSEVVNSL